MTSSTAPVRLGEAALAYAARGWHVFPLAPRGKRPICEHGFLEATRDAVTIRKWWEESPSANVGGATGLEAGLLVVDIDVGHGGKDTIEAFVRVHGRLPKTLVSRTGGGGWHAFFRHPGGHIPSRTKVLGPGVDVRADGGYVVLPPSVHKSGRIYAWLDDSAVVAEPTTALVALVRPRPIPPYVPSRRAAVTGSSAYADAALRGEADAVRATAEGGRNERLNLAAFNLGQLVASGVLDESVVASQLLDAALACGLGEREARATIARGVRGGIGKPRTNLRVGAQS